MAVVASLLIFTLAAACGFAALTAVLPREQLFRRLLWAPASGFALFELVLFTCSRLGLAVDAIAVPLSAGAVLAFAATVLVKRPRISARRLLAFAAIVVTVYAANAIPLARLGSAWLGFVNGDILYYCMGADDLRRHGSADVPSGAALDARTELARVTAGNYAYEGAREGAELVLAFASSLERVHPDEAAMGLQVAFAAALACAAGALIATSARRRTAAAIGGAAAGALPLMGYSVFNGLMAQLLGSMFLALAFALIAPGGDGRRGAARAAAGGVAAAALLVAYPEMAPFLVAALALRALIVRRVPLSYLTATLTMALVLNWYLRVAVAYSINALTARGAVALPQTGGAHTHFLFPYLLQPIGQANLWGLAAFAPSPSDPRTQFGIAAGILASIAAIVVLVVRRREPAVALAAVLTAVLAVLMIKRADFGSFKAALFLQPFLAVALATVGRRALVPLVWLVAALPVQAYYVDRSFGAFESVGNHYVQVPGASISRLADRLERAAAGAPALFVATANGNIRTLALLRQHGTPLYFAQGRSLPITEWNPLERLQPTVDGVAIDPRRYIHDVLLPRAREGARARIRFDAAVAVVKHVNAPPAGARTVRSDDMLSVLNRRTGGAQSRKNALLDIGTSLSTDAADGLYPPERDPYRPAQTMAAASRYVVFEVFDPAARGRLSLDLESAFVGAGTADLPPARVVTADGILPLDVAGAGAARVLSAPLRPIRQNDRSYIALDFGANPPADAAPALPGLWNLWGRDIVAETRDVVTYVRDISFLPDAPQPPAPRAVRRFPADLADVALRFSGIYDDGWLSPRSYAVLRSVAGDRLLRIRFDIPASERSQTGASERCTVLVDGKAVAQLDGPPGAYDEGIALARLRAGDHRIDVRFAGAARLGKQDRRIAGALLRELTFAPY